MLSPSYFLILILGSQRKTLEQGSTATFPKKYTHRFVAGFVLFFINLLLSNRYGPAISFCLVPQGILGALCLETDRPGTLGDEANFPASPVPDGQRDSEFWLSLAASARWGISLRWGYLSGAAQMALLGLGDWQSTSLHFPEASGLEHWFLSWVSLAEQSTPLSCPQSLGAVPQSWCLNSLAGLPHSGCRTWVLGMSPGLPVSSVLSGQPAAPTLVTKGWCYYPCRETGLAYYSPNAAFCKPRGPLVGCEVNLGFLRRKIRLCHSNGRYCSVELLLKC